MNRWDVARVDRTCIRCPGPILAGEQYRHFGPKNLPVCIACAKTATGEDPPADMPVIPTLPTLKEPEQWFEPPPSTLPPLHQVMPPLASPKQRARLIQARRRLERPQPTTDLQRQERERWWDR